MPRLTVGELTDEWAGWFMKVATGSGATPWRYIELKSVRSHALPGGRSAIVAKDHEGRFAGLEYHWPHENEVVLEHPITAKAKRKAKELAGVS